MLTLACTELDHVKMSAPERPTGAQGMILIVARTDAPLELWAFDFERSDPRLLSLPPEGDFELYALMLDCTFAALGIEEGKLSLAEGGRALPNFSVIERSTYAGGVQSSWEAATLPPALADLQISGAEPDPCELYTTTFEQHELPLAGTTGENPIFAVPIDADSVLVATTEGQFFRVDDTSATPLTTLSTMTPHSGAFARADGELWLFGHGGEVMRGRLETGFVAAPSLSTRTGFERIAVDGSKEGPIELFALTDNGVFEHFDGTTWTILDQSESVGDFFKIDVAWLGPGRAIAVIANPNRIIRFDASGVEVDALPASEGPMCVLLSPLGVVIGGTSGSILLDEPNGFSSVGRSPFEDRIVSFLSYGPGFFVTSSKGVGAVYDPRAGFCRIADYAVSDSRPIVPMKDGLLLVSRSVALSEAIIVSFLRPGAPACGATR